MFVVKRGGRKEPVSFDKITARIRKLCYGLNDEYVDPVVVAQKVCGGVYKGVTTLELDELAAETAAHMISFHPDFGILAARVCVSNLHKQTKKVFSDVVEDLYRYVEPKTGEPAPLIGEATYRVVCANKDRLNAAVIYDRDFEYDYFGFKTLERSYLLKLDGEIAERPQQMLMRVAVGIHGDDIDSAVETYEMMSQRLFTHASPTLFNAGTPRPQLSSCFLVTMKGDSIEGIYDTLKDCAMISKHAGGIGLAVHDIRATGSYIRGTNGTSNGLVPMLRVFNNTARYVDQGGGKRKGAFACYLEPWHADIFAFLDLRKNHGKEEDRARDLFLGLWTPDLFMRRVEENGQWSLFCPHEAPGLVDAVGDDFVALYERYEREGRARETIKARDVWRAVLEAQIEGGTPYILFKDAANLKSNQQNLGTIRCSNLCTEIVQFSSPEEIAVCNLASVALPNFVRDGAYDFEEMQRIVRVMTRNLNKVIDVNHYPVEEARRSNMRHRPMGIGVQGLADTFLLLKLPFDSPEARQLNRDIFEAIYFAAVSASCELAEAEGPYESFAGSPASQGRLQFDLWGVEPSDRWDWAGLKARIARHGLRNSLLVAPMPTASTASILSNHEAFEPLSSVLYVRRTLAGEFVCPSKHLLRDLIDRGLWSEEMRQELIAHNGSVQRIEGMPEDLKALYKTAYELSGKTLLDMAADRGAFIDQSQSLNLHMQNVNAAKLTSSHFHAWKRGLKTGCYYLRTKAAVDAVKVTLTPGQVKAAQGARAAPSTPDKRVVATVSAKAAAKLAAPDSAAKAPASAQSGDDAVKPDKPRDVEEWRRQREQAKVEADMLCSLENKDACMSCGS